MGSRLNFKNYGEAPQGEGKPPGNSPLVRQSSVYSLTFEELQNTWGGIGKDLGSMNMDELLKNIWTAEETQAMISSVGGGGAEGSVPGGNLQRQGSLTLPRTLSQKTVDEVWKDLLKETTGGGAGNGSASGGDSGGGGSNFPQRQPTLGEMTLEEFLVRAGVVREDTQQIAERPNNGGFYANNNNNGLALGLQQLGRNNGLTTGRIMDNDNSVSQPSSLAMNVAGLRSSQQQQQQQLHQYQPQQQLHQYQPQQQQAQYQQQQQQQRHYQPSQQQPLFPKQATVAFASPMNLVNTTQLTSPRARGSVSASNPTMNNNLAQAGGLQSGGMGMAGLGTGGVTVATGSPVSQVSPDMIVKGTADRSSCSPVPYVFSRGRKCSAVEKVVERRHRRMIKNRESAARSRARKQAYTLELEAEVAKLKEVNEELQKKQNETMEMQKKQILETMKRQWGGKRECLRRTLTGPW